MEIIGLRLEWPVLLSQVELLGIPGSLAVLPDNGTRVGNRVTASIQVERMDL